MHGARNKLMLNFGYRNRNLVTHRIDDMAKRDSIEKREKVNYAHDWHVRQHTLRGCNLLK